MVEFGIETNLKSEAGSWPVAKRDVRYLHLLFSLSWSKFSPALKVVSCRVASAWFLCQPEFFCLGLWKLCHFTEVLFQYSCLWLQDKASVTASGLRSRHKRTFWYIGQQPYRTANVIRCFCHKPGRKRSSSDAIDEDEYLSDCASCASNNEY